MSGGIKDPVRGVGSKGAPLKGYKRAQLTLAGMTSEYRCTACGASSPVRKDKCVVCKKWGTYVNDAGGVSEPLGWAPESLSKIKMDKVQRVRLEEPALDAFFGGGLVRSCSYLFSAPPGAGKSSWALAASQFFKSPLYVASEETKGAIKLRANRFKIDIPYLHVVETHDMEMVAKNISDAYDAIIIDSTHRMRTDDSNASIGSATQVESVIALASDIVRKLGIVGIFIGHMNKELEASGKLSNQHDVDGTIDILVKENTRTFVITKHRHGPTPARVQCVMTERGLDHFETLSEETGES